MEQTRTRHSQAYKDEALALAERLGVSKTAEQLGLHPSQISRSMGGVASGRKSRIAASGGNP